MRRVCAWCGAFLGWVDGDVIIPVDLLGAAEELVSHGMCEACRERLEAEDDEADRALSTDAEARVG